MGAVKYDLHNTVLGPKRIRKPVPSQRHELRDAAFFGSKPYAKVFRVGTNFLHGYADTRVRGLAELDVTVCKNLWHNWT